VVGADGEAARLGAGAFVARLGFVLACMCNSC